MGNNKGGQWRGEQWRQQPVGADTILVAVATVEATCQGGHYSHCGVDGGGRQRRRRQSAADNSVLMAVDGNSGRPPPPLLLAAARQFSADNGQ
jgi:hypothetical protein